MANRDQNKSSIRKQTLLFFSGPRLVFVIWDPEGRLTVWFGLKSTHGLCHIFDKAQ